MNHSEIVSFLWSVADLIRDSFKRGKYQDVILPLTVLRRLDCVLAETKEAVLKRQAELSKRGLQDLVKALRTASGFAFYNTSRYDFDKLLGDAPQVAANLRNYIAGFSENMRNVLERFDFDNTISKLEEAGLLFQVLERFKNVDLHPDRIDNATMGTIFEELIRRFNEALDENPGEHFTPRDVVHLMVDLMLAGDESLIADQRVVCKVYDPCCGSGGMLMIAKEHITVGFRRNGSATGTDLLRPAINAEADIYLYGQEVNPETWAVSKSDIFMKDPTGRDAENIAFGSTLSNDLHAGKTFEYLIANPPYGKDWKRDHETVESEHQRGAAGRFGPGLPRISDGQTLFLLHMLAHANPPDQGGARIAIIMNGSPLFTGDAGSGESEIRRFIFENDLLEALITLPEQLFYNTGIATYVWLLTNRKAAERKGKVQLIDATSFWSPMRRSLGDKRREIPPESAQEVLTLLSNYRDGATRTQTEDGNEEEVVVSRIFPTTQFGFRRITVERPLRLNFQASPERIARLEEQKGFENLAKSKKRGEAGAKEEATGRAQQGSPPNHAEADARHGLQEPRSLSCRPYVGGRQGRPQADRSGEEGDTQPRLASKTPRLRSVGTRTASRSQTPSFGIRSVCRSWTERTPRTLMKCQPASERSSSAKSNLTSPTPGSTHRSATTRTERSVWLATRSTSTAISTGTSRPGPSRRSGRISRPLRMTSWRC